MSKYTTRELQLKMLEVLDYIDEVCRKNGLTYYLAYGTLLGAIRHKGFIPWDDDADVMMERSECRTIRIMSCPGREYTTAGQEAETTFWKRVDRSACSLMFSP